MAGVTWVSKSGQSPDRFLESLNARAADHRATDLMCERRDQLFYKAAAFVMEIDRDEPSLRV